MDWLTFLKAPFVRCKLGAVPLDPSRRAFIKGAAAVVLASSIMPVRIPLIAATEEDLVEVDVLYGGQLPADGAIAAELQAVTRRALMPRVYVQLWQSAPLMASLLRRDGFDPLAVRPRPLLPAFCAHTEFVGPTRKLIT